MIARLLMYTCYFLIVNKLLNKLKDTMDVSEPIALAQIFYKAFNCTAKYYYNVSIVKVINLLYRIVSMQLQYFSAILVILLIFKKSLEIF